MVNSLKRLSEYIAGKEVRLYFQSAVAMALIPGIQFFTFALAAKGLGASQFGIFVAFQASSAIGLEIAGLGAGERLIRSIARWPDRYPEWLGQCIAAVIPTTILAILVSAFIVFGTVGVRHLLIGAAFVGAEIASFRTLTICEQVSLSYSRIWRANFARLLPAILRVIATTILTIAGLANLANLSAVYVASGLASAAICVLLTFSWYGRPGAIRVSWKEVLAGLPYALNQLARALQYNIDRLIVAAFLPASSVAVYAAATRFVQVANLPVSALLRIYYPRMFAAENADGGGRRRLAVAILPSIVGLSCISTIVLACVSPFLTNIFGNEYAGSEAMLRFLCPVVILTAVGYVGADMLTGSDKPYLRVWIMLTAIGCQTTWVVLLASKLGVYSAASGIYVSAAIIAALSWWFSLRTAKSKK